MAPGAFQQLEELLGSIDVTHVRFGSGTGTCKIHGRCFCVRSTVKSTWDASQPYAKSSQSSGRP